MLSEVGRGGLACVVDVQSYLIIPFHRLWAKSNNSYAWSIWIWRDLVLFLF